ncbi:MAG TPA: response regulator transcription factor [Terriglobales bacterium]|nr:response regulator transcription factor [Terriglobales bacterium]
MEPEKPAPPKVVTILLVDDVEQWRRSVCSMLQTYPRLHIVAEAADGLEAVQKAQELQPDVILLDIGLPCLNGIEAAHRIDQVAPRTKILFLTQNPDWEIARAALSDCARGYVVKADAGHELLPAIESVFRGEKFVSRRVRNQELSATTDAGAS